jgi:ribosomal protein L37AE/L43A
MRVRLTASNLKDKKMIEIAEKISNKCKFCQRTLTVELQTKSVLQRVEISNSEIQQAGRAIGYERVGVVFVA